MKEAKAKIPAKLNLALDVIGLENGYHTLETLVCSVNLYDVVTVKIRSDGKINLKEKGIKSGAKKEDNNAYKTFKRFFDGNKITGADIVVKKGIFVGAGLGGSSADIAGVSKCLQKIYRLTEKETLNLANACGSDSGYMLRGGYAVLSGRGNVVTPLKNRRKLYMLLIKGKSAAWTKEVFGEFDRLAKVYQPTAKKAAEFFENGEHDLFLSALKNDLTKAASGFCPEIENAVSALKKSGAVVALMTGSGPTVFGIYVDKKSRDAAFRKLKKEYGKRLIKVHSL